MHQCCKFVMKPWNGSASEMKRNIDKLRASDSETVYILYRLS